MDVNTWIAFAAVLIAALVAVAEWLRRRADRRQEQSRIEVEERRHAAAEERVLLMELQEALESLNTETMRYLSSRVFGSRRPGPAAAESAYRRLDVKWAQADDPEVRHAVQRFGIACQDVIALDDVNEFRRLQTHLHKTMALELERATEAIARRLREISLLPGPSSG